MKPVGDTKSKPGLPVVWQVGCVVIAALVRVYIKHVSHFYEVYGAHFFQVMIIFHTFFKAGFGCLWFVVSDICLCPFYFNSAGGVELLAKQGRIKVVNTLESRLEMMSRQVCGL